MASNSIAQRVLELVETMEENLDPIVEQVPAVWMPQLKNVYMALENLKSAAVARAARSEYESARRRGEPTGTVMAQGGPRG